jgi:serine/threonine protein phosphatase PrpC
MMKILSSGRSDPGKKRKNNEDSFLRDDGLALYAVADGIGGHEGGEVASRIAMDTLKEVMPGLLKGKDVTPPFSLSLDVEPRISALRYAITLSNQKILHAASTNTALTGMGTTITAVLLCYGTAFIAHVGDSRAYLLRSGQCDQITNDHSFVAEQIRAGKLTAEQAKTSAYRHIITRAVGIDREVAVDHATIAVQVNDTLLLCTDGLTEMIDDGEICAILAGSTPEAATENLIRRANEQGGVDNITAVVLKILAND